MKTCKYQHLITSICVV